MKNAITYHWGEDNLFINLGNRTQKRIAILYWGELIFTIGMATIFLMGSFPLSNGWVHWVSAIGSASLYLLAAYRFVSRMFYQERLFLDKEGMLIVRHSPFSHKMNRYEWELMGAVHYIGKPDKTAHPLKGGCYDYFGFDTHEQLIQDLHHEGNMYFNYLGYSICFGKNVYSWDAEEMVYMMKIFAGTDLQLGPEWKSMLQEQ